MQKAALNSSNVVCSFAMFDKDKSGFIDRSELKTVMESMGQTPSDEQITESLKMMDMDGDGKISEEEFLKFMGAMMQALKAALGA